MSYSFFKPSLAQRGFPGLLFHSLARQGKKVKSRKVCCTTPFFSRDKSLLWEKKLKWHQNNLTVNTIYIYTYITKLPYKHILILLPVFLFLLCSSFMFTSNPNQQAEQLLLFFLINSICAHNFIIILLTRLFFCYSCLIQFQFCHVQLEFFAFYVMFQ